MILVLSYDTYEQGTDPVISWLLHYQVPFIKVSLADLLYGKVRYYVDLPNRDVVIDGLSVKQAITTIWHRRFAGAANRLDFPAGSYQDQLAFEVRTEITDLLGYLELLFRDKKWLTAFQQIKVNKLELLDVASRCGLRVPHTQVLNNRHDLLAFYHQLDAQLISKPIADVRGSYPHEDCTYVMLTNCIDEARIAAVACARARCDEAAKSGGFTTRQKEERKPVASRSHHRADTARAQVQRDAICGGRAGPFRALDYRGRRRRLARNGCLPRGARHADAV